MSSGNYSPRLYQGVMISSTFTDLEHHRAALIKALKGQGLTDSAMENGSAKLLDVIDSSLQMVRDASAYIVVIGRKYGQTPTCSTRNPQEPSITELEFNEAQQLSRPILLFIMGDNHLVRWVDVETNPAKIEKLNAFRERAKKIGPNSQVHRVYATFDSLEDFAIKAERAVAGLRRYLDQRAESTQPKAVALAPAPTVLIPNERPPAAKKFYGRQTDRQDLIRRLRDRENVAVVGPAGIGKTALAAEALRAVVGETSKSLAESPYPEGVVYLDLYAMHGAVETAWGTLANKLAGLSFMESSPARDRASAACQGRSILLVIEGGEEADGKDGRPAIMDLFSVLSPENRWLLLTRLRTQALPAESVMLEDSLPSDDAAQLFDSLTQNRVKAGVRQKTLELLEGHPLALTWAGNLLALGDESPEYLVDDWSAAKLPSLSDPKKAQHTLEWLFERSVRGLDEAATRALAAAGLLANAPFTVLAIDAALHNRPDERATRQALRTLIQRGLLRLTEDDQRQFTHVLGYRFARKDTGSDPELRARLGNWLNDELARALKAGEPTSITSFLEHLAALLRADDDQSLWQPLVEGTLYDFGDRFTALGRLGQLRMTLDAVAGWLEQFPPNKTQEPKWLRERAVLLDRMGTVLLDQGDLGGAKESYQQALDARQRLAATDPLNPNWERDLSVSHDKVGNVLMAQGDLEAAQASYQSALQIDRRLAASVPSNTIWQHDLSVSYDRVGNLLFKQGDLAGAKDSYQQSLEVRRRLTASDPSKTGWQRDLSTSHTKVGDVLKDQGDSAGALASYQQSLEIDRRLAASDPSNAGWQRDLSFSLTRMAELYEQSDRPQALLFAQESLTIDERLARLDSTNATWQKDVIVSRALVARLGS